MYILYNTKSDFHFYFLTISWSKSMRSELSNALSNVIKAWKLIEKDLVEIYLHFHVKSWKSIEISFFWNFQDLTWKWRYTSTRSFSMSFKALITFESALESSDPILFYHEFFWEVNVEIRFCIVQYVHCLFDKNSEKSHFSTLIHLAGSRRIHDISSEISALSLS